MSSLTHGAGATRIVGILNVTPDSFSDGGRFLSFDAAIRRGLELADQGADWIDVGGESTRPGAGRVPGEVERARIVPVIERLAAEGLRVSVDTMRADTARAAVSAGAQLVNDVSGGLADPDMFRTVADLQVPMVLMHWRGHSEHMERLATYEDVVDEVGRELSARIDAAVDAGIDGDRILIDPGLGFAKRPEHNWELLRALDRLIALGFPVLVGASRKRFLAGLASIASTPAEGTDWLDEATAAVTVLAAAAGAWGVRVHEPARNVSAAAVGSVCRGAGRSVDRPVARELDSDRICVTGIECFGHHGVLPIERRDGQRFVIDVVLHTSTRRAAARDDLAATVDYSEVVRLVTDRVSGTPFDLIESLAEAIAGDLLALAGVGRGGVDRVDVVVHKPDAPLPAPVADVSVSIGRTA